MSTAHSVLQVQDLSFSWARRHVLTAWSARCEGGLTWLQGANGCGKSTLLQLLAGALPPLAGAWGLHLADGRRLDAAADPQAWKRAVFWCGPGAIAFDHLTPTEYAGFIAGLYPGFDAAALARHLAGFQLGPHLDIRLAALSTGTQRKVWLAVALSVGTPLRLLDEPGNALDTASLAWLHQALAEAAAQREVVWLVASHEPAPLAQGARLLTLAG
jgi:ABC-type multidrug transport system ATPase subunit